MTIFADLPPATRKLFDHLINETVYLHTDWHLYHQLSSEDAVKTFYHCCGSFAQTVYRCLVESIILRAVSLAGPATNGRHKNLSLEALMVAMPGHIEQDLENQLQSDLDQLKAHCAAMKTHRDKRIAHLDQAVAMNEVTMPNLVVADVDEALRMIRKFMNGLETPTKRGPLNYEEAGAMVRNRDADALISHLKRSLRAIDLFNRIGEGTVTKDEVFEQIEWDNHPH